MERENHQDHMIEWQEEQAANAAREEKRREAIEKRVRKLTEKSTIPHKREAEMRILNRDYTLGTITKMFSSLDQTDREYAVKLLFSQLSGASHATYLKAKVRKHLWADGYYCGTAGHVRQEQVRRYIEEQNKHLFIKKAILDKETTRALNKTLGDFYG